MLVYIASFLYLEILLLSERVMYIVPEFQLGFCRLEGRSLVARD